MTDTPRLPKNKAAIDATQRLMNYYRIDNGDTLYREIVSFAAQVTAERDALREATNALLHQIDISDFTDSHGHDARMLKPVHDLMRMLGGKP